MLKNHTVIRYLRDNWILASASGVFVIQLGFAGLTFLVGYILARVLGANGLGAYDYAESWVEILMVVAVFGFDRLFVRKLPAYEAAGDWSRMKGIWHFGMLLSVLVVLLLIVIFAGLFMFWFGTSTLTWSAGFFPGIVADSSNTMLLTTSLLALPLLPLRVGLRFLAGVMQGLQHVSQGLLPDYIVRLGLFLLLVIIVALVSPGQLSAGGAMGLHISGAVIAVGYGIYHVRHLIPDTMRQAKAIYQPREWLATSTSFVAIMAAALINARIGILILGSFAPLEHVALFSISLRIAAVIVLVQTAMNLTLQPRIARLYALGEMAELQTLVTMAVRHVVLVSLPVAIAFIIFGRQMLAIFGHEFPDAYPLLVIMCIGYFLNTLAGPVANLLMMTSYELDTALAGVVVVIISGLLTWVLVQRYGAIGAAIAVSIGLVLRNAVLIIIVHWRLGIWTLPFDRGLSK